MHVCMQVFLHVHMCMRDYYINISNLHTYVHIAFFSKILVSLSGAYVCMYVSMYVCWDVRMYMYICHQCC